tara:strand:+ start:1533 stop:2465 length:933 start_codon:yes stop_codon:yes gene_type:complete
MNRLKIVFILIIITLISTLSYSKETVLIIYNINNELITNVDVKREVNYLIALNDQLKNLSKKQILEIAEESIVRETIKKIELNNFFDLKIENSRVDNYIKNLFTRLNLRNEEELMEYLQNYGLTLDVIKKKIQIEITWNQFIYDKFKDQIKIDNEKIVKEIESSENKSNEKLYLLSEIMFEVENKNELNKKKDNIEKSIKEIGFKNSANIYSVSDSSKLGGDIGWVAEKEISKTILNKINNLEIGQYTKPFPAGSSFLILRVDDLKFEKKKINKEEQLDKKIRFETERQLKQFSKIYYNRVKINTSIDEL